MISNCVDDILNPAVKLFTLKGDEKVSIIFIV